MDDHQPLRFERRRGDRWPVHGKATAFRIAGPLYRFETYLRSIIRGEEPRDMKLRRGGALQELCELLKRALEVTRAAAALPAGKLAQESSVETAA